MLQHAGGHPEENGVNALYRSLSIALALTVAFVARAEYPNRPVRMVLPFSAGGAADAVARVLAPALEARLRQPVIIENRPGAEGLLAGQAVAAAPPDGYTILYAVSATAALPFVSTTSYSAADFTPITTIGTYDFAMFVSTTLPVTTVSEFVEYAKAHPGKLNYATLNVGEHFAAAQFIRAAGIDMTRVPYRSMAQILPDMLAGQVHVNFGPLINGMAHVKAGRMRVLATLSPQRSPFAPEVPTMREAGHGGVAFESVQMLFAASKTRPEIVEKLSREVNAALAQPDVRAQLEKITLRVKGSTPESLRQAQADSSAAWTRFAAEYHLSAE
jgi:tripartite-type tricarboxylate transporter receptor subunit TctC